MIDLGEFTLTTLSASKLKTFSSCEKKYYYEYIEKACTDRHPAAALGTSVHKTIEHVYREQTDPIATFSEIFGKEIAQYEDTGIDLRKYQTDGIKMVRQYNFARRTPTAMEVEFLLPFPNQAHALCQIRGFIDQTYDWGFVDLKTNRTKPLNSVLDNDLQFLIYDWAFEQINGYEARDKIWHQLRTGEDLYADTVGKLDNVTRVIERILDSYMTGIYDRSVGDPCRICSHRKACLGRSD